MGRKVELKIQELDLIPIMNTVMILIPLLLLAVEFEQMGVVNITAPKLSVGPPAEEQTPPEQQPLNLTIGISTTGFTIAATGAKLPPIAGCPEAGTATVCSKQGKDIAAMLGDVRSLRDKLDASGNRDFLYQSDKKLLEMVDAYDFRQLYNQLVDIKKKFPDERVVNIGADADIPYEVVVRTMDAIRYKLEAADGGAVNTEAEFYQSKYQENTSGDEKFAPLFPDVALAVIQ